MLSASWRGFGHAEAMVRTASFEGEAVDDGLGRAGAVEHAGPPAEGEVDGDDQRSVFVAFG